MLTNTSVWTRYQPGYIDELVAPFQRKKVIDRWGNEVSINTWEKLPPVPSPECPGLIEPALLRVNKGLTFQRMFETDPCPSGFVKSKEEPSYCVRVTPKHEQVFYSDKAFIPKRQYWKGYSDGNATRNSSSGPEAQRSPSSPFDMRTVDPFTGNYTIYYESNKSASQTRYGKPITSTRKQYDRSWYLDRTAQYATLDTTDSYLG
jgi:hypothetical protein